jgi:hypothetical protein
MAYGVGRVSGSPQTLNDGHASRLITVALSDFVRGETKASTVQYVPGTFKIAFSSSNNQMCLRLIDGSLDTSSDTPGQYCDAVLWPMSRP